MHNADCFVTFEHYGTTFKAKIDAKTQKILKKEVGAADAKKFNNALKKGIVPPDGHSGIKALKGKNGKYTHELKIGRSGQRILGYLNEHREYIFDNFVRGGLHKQKR